VGRGWGCGATRGILAIGDLFMAPLLRLVAVGFLLLQQNVVLLFIVLEHQGFGRFGFFRWVQSLFKRRGYFKRAALGNSISLLRNGISGFFFEFFLNDFFYFYSNASIVMATINNEIL